MASHNTSILLPDADIDVFALSSETKHLAQDIKSDWRFGRVTLNARDGGADAAIDLYQESASPDLLIVETDTIDDAFIERLQTLGQYCTEGTNAVVIGPDNDIQLYRKLKDMGVSDYYVHPVDGETIKDDIAGILIESKGISASRIMSFVPAKGGVGTTTLSQALALGITGQLDEPVLIIECAGGRSSASIALAKSEPNGTMAEAIRAAMNNDSERLNRMIIEGPNNLHILSTGGEPVLSDAPEAEQFEALLDMLSGRFANIIIDLGTGNGMVEQMAICKSTDVLLVTDPGIVSLRSARTLMHEILSLRGQEKQDVYYIVNRLGEKPGFEVNKKDIAESLEMPASGGIAYNARLFGATEFGEKKLSDDDNGQKIISLLLKIFARDSKGSSKTAKNLDKSKKKTSGIGGFLNKFTS